MWAVDPTVVLGMKSPDTTPEALMVMEQNERHTLSRNRYATYFLRKMKSNPVPERVVQVHLATKSALSASL